MASYNVLSVCAIASDWRDSRQVTIIWGDQQALGDQQLLGDQQALGGINSYWMISRHWGISK